jgi:hypothetical protein
VVKSSELELCIGESYHVSLPLLVRSKPRLNVLYDFAISDIVPLCKSIAVVTVGQAKLKVLLESWI